jgi:hypothetical protein
MPNLKREKDPVHKAEEFAKDAAKLLVLTEKKQAPFFAQGLQKWPLSRRPLTLAECTFRIEAWKARLGGPQGASGNLTAEWFGYSGEQF